MVHKGTGAPSLNRGGAEAARGAHNSEVIGSNPISGIYHPIAMVHKGTGAPSLNRGGAEAARGAHNSEDIRSKRISGILPICQF